MASRCDSKYYPVAIQFLSMAICAFFCIYSIFGFINFNPARLAVNVYVLLFGLIGFIADVRCFNVFGYIKFIYTPIGRGLLFLFIGFLVLAQDRFSLISGIVMLVMGILYFIMAQLFGGVPRPLLQRNVEDLPLNTELRFVDSPDLSPGHRPYGSQPVGARAAQQGFRI